LACATVVDYDGGYNLIEAREEVLTQDILCVLQRAHEVPADAGGEAVSMENHLADQVSTAHPTEGVGIEMWRAHE